MAITTKDLRTAGAFVLTLGAVMSLGFLSFVGVLALTPCVALACAAFALAVAYEGQVLTEGMRIALLRLSDKNYLACHIIDRFLEECSEQDNEFLSDYIAQKNYLAKLEEYEHFLEEQDIDDKKDQLKNIKLKITHAEKRLTWMKLFIVNQLSQMKINSSPQTAAEQSARELLAKHHKVLSQEIRDKSRWIKIGGLFAIIGGVCTGLTALSSMQLGLIALGIASVVPGGALFVAAGLAALASILILHQAFAEMAQQFTSFKAYLERKPDESKGKHIARCVATVVIASLALIATVASAGTAWFAAKSGAEFFMSGGAASVVRSITVAAMAVSSFIFSVTGSIESVNDISDSDYGALGKKIKSDFYQAWDDDLQAANFSIPLAFVLFFNPLRLLSSFLETFGKGIFFLGHILSIAVTTDRGIEPQPLSVAAGATTEATIDMKYLPNEKDDHNHQSWMLTALLLPLTLTITILKCCAFVWDMLALCSVAKAKQRFLGETKVVTKKVEPEKPVLSQSWQQQEVIEVCDSISTRLSKRSNGQAKVQAARVIRENVLQASADQFVLTNMAEPFAQNRNCLWRVSETQSQSDMANALRDYPKFGG